MPVLSKKVFFFRKIFITIMIIFNIPNAYSQNSENSMPQDFLYQNQPIDAFCISKLANVDETKSIPVNIDECTRHPQAEFDKVNEELSKKKFIGYDYKETLPTGYVTHGYNYYRYLGKIDNLHILYSIQNGGGSGEFTAVFLARRNGSFIHLAKMLAEGDRCNGGVSNVIFKDKKIQFEQALTPYDIVNLSNQKLEKLKAYDDLAACAVCCIGNASYEFSNNELKLNNIIINKDAGNNNASVQGKYQSCFDNIIKESIANNKEKWTQSDLDEFVKKFNETCVKQ